MNFLIVRLDNLGDILLTLPIARALKQEASAEKVFFLVRNEEYANVVKLSRDVDMVFVYRDGVYREIRRLEDEIAVIFVYGSFKDAFRMFLAGFPIRVGNGYKPYMIFLNRFVFQKRRVEGKHEIEYNLELVSSFGVKSKIIPPKISLPFERVKDIRNRFKRYLKEINIAIHPLKRDTSLIWSIENFRELILKIYERFGDRVSIFVSGYGDFEVKTIEREILPVLKQGLFVKNRGIEELAGIYSLMDIVIANSTGPLHLASALGVNTIGFFALSKAQHKRRWGAYGEGININLSPPFPDCNKCIGEMCPYYNCLNHISPDFVLTKIEFILSEIGKK